MGVDRETGSSRLNGLKNQNKKSGRVWQQACLKDIEKAEHTPAYCSLLLLKSTSSEIDFVLFDMISTRKPHEGTTRNRESIDSFCEDYDDELSHHKEYF